MSKSGLPEDGVVRLGSVLLPAGKRYFPTEDAPPGSSPGEAVAWVTDSPLPEAGRLWWVLSDLHAQTGLVPFLAGGPEDGIEYLFFTRFDVARLDHMSAADVLSGLWADDTPPDWDEWDAEDRAPFGRKFPGLAPGEGARLNPKPLAAAVDSLAAAEDSPGPFRIGLTVARRPADVLPAIGWLVTDAEHPDALEVAAVLRSWEDRFGARLVQFGPPGTIKLLVERPPRTFETALALAAEHYMLCHQSQLVEHSVAAIAEALVGAPIWRLWWD